MKRRILVRGPWQRLAAACGLAVGLAALAAPGCDKMPLVAPSDTTITLHASRTSVGLNGTVDITATVIEPAGTPVQNGTVVTFTTTLGTLSPAEARTSGGKATVRLDAGSKSGTAEVNAFSGSSSAGSTVSIAVGTAAAGGVTLLADPSALPAAGGTVQLTAIVTDASGNRLPGVPVTFSTNAGVLSLTAVTSDGNGEARSSLSTTQAAAVTATVVGGASAAMTSSVNIPVRTAPTVTLSVPSGTLVPGVPVVFTVTVAAGSSAVRAASIDFGDGSAQAVSTAGSSSATHTYGSSGTYVVTARATDSAGETTTATASATVSARVPPTVTLTIPSGGILPGVPAVFTVSVTAGSSAVRSASIDFGDGDDQAVSNTGTSSVTHTYRAGGTYIVTARATDASGETTVSTASVGVQNVIVSVTLTVSSSALTTTTPAEFTATATTSPAGSTIERYEWDFGDGSTRVTSSGATNHLYLSGGGRRYTVTVRAVTASGASGSAQREVIVN